MTTRILYFCLSLMILSSCTTQVIKIEDRVRKSSSYQWDTRKYSVSKINRTNRYFQIFIRKNGTDPDKIIFQVNSTFPVIEADFLDTAFVIKSREHHNFPFNHWMDNIQYKEELKTINTTTRTDVQVTTENTTKVEPVKSVTLETESQKTTDTQTTTTSSTTSDTNVRSEILDKIHSKRYFSIDKQLLRTMLAQQYFKLRLYNLEGDFWEIPFNEYEVRQILKILNNKYDRLVF